MLVLIESGSWWASAFLKPHLADTASLDANYEYENFHVFAVESVRDENGEKNFVALGVLGFWLMLDKKGQSIKALQADDSDDE